MEGGGDRQGKEGGGRGSGTRRRGHRNWCTPSGVMGGVKVKVVLALNTREI